MISFIEDTGRNNGRSKCCRLDTVVLSDFALSQLLRDGPSHRLMSYDSMRFSLLGPSA